MRQEKTPSESTITRGSFPASKKVYVPGKIHDIKVAMREIELHDTVEKFNPNAKPQKNSPVTVYDTSGPYTDPNVKIDVRKGLPKLREQWVLDRDDTEELPSITSEYGKQRLNDNSLDSLRFEHLKNPRKAKPGKNVTQLHYARKGIITPEMEYIAIRENQRLEEQTEYLHQHPGQSFGANTPKGMITPEFVRDEVAAEHAEGRGSGAARKAQSLQELRMKFKQDEWQYFAE